MPTGVITPSVSSTASRKRLDLSIALEKDKAPGDRRLAFDSLGGQ
jgi:hypothetical protein